MSRQFPPEKDDPIWRLHHAFTAAWDQLPDLWLDIPSTEKLFGKLTELETLVLANQWMQGEGARFLIEELRRKMPHTCGVIWWGVNEPWPGLAGNASSTISPAPNWACASWPTPTGPPSSRCATALRGAPHQARTLALP